MDLPETARANDEIVVMIRQCSEEGRIIAEDEILKCAARLGILILPWEDQGEEVKSILDGIEAKSGDVRTLVARDGSRWFYSAQYMTDAYADLLLQKQEDPVQLIAAIVRENSRAYPRPVPLDYFTRHPFDLSGQEVLDYVKQMTADHAYADIVSITTSTSMEFLYSTLHLEPAHASLLAEWFDTGQASNP